MDTTPANAARPFARLVLFCAPLLLSIGGLCDVGPVVASPLSPAGASVDHRDLRSGDALIARVPASPGALAGDAPLAPERSRGGWVFQTQVPNVLTGVSFSDATHGFASAELGAVYKTTNGGLNWTSSLNLGFPYYWYGVHAFSAQTAVIAGFHNQNGSGIIRWTDNGGATWSSDVVIDPANWLLNIRFADALHGIAYGYSGYVYVTQNGGRTAGDWTKIQADPTAGWFAGNFTFDTQLRSWVTGISFCRSTDGGATWTRRPSADPVFDGGVSFVDAATGWTGGGQISSPVTGWVHRSTNGGGTWTGRILQTNYPIRVVQFFTTTLGFAAGGTRFGNAGGGIWQTTDSGNQWTLDVDTGAEMSGIDWKPATADSADVWCVGFLPTFQGVIYNKRIGWTAPADVPGVALGAPRLDAFPNPFVAYTRIAGATAGLTVIDAAGRVVRMLQPSPLAGATVWDGRDAHGEVAPSGVYFLRMETGAETRVVRLRR